MYGIHSISRRIASPLPRIFKPLALAAMLSLTACAGGDIVFEGGSQANATVDENSSGVVWTAKVQVKGALDSKDVVFSLSGEDAALFALNPTSGALNFKAPPNFEAPLDTDKNNEYRVALEAKLNGVSATQGVRLRINNITQPVVELVQPKLNANVGKGETIEVDTVVRFYDAESKTPIHEGSLSLNGAPLVKSVADANLWTGKMLVPAGGAEFSLAGTSSKNKQVKLSGKFFNKANAIKPAGFGAFAEDNLVLMVSGFTNPITFNQVADELVGECFIESSYEKSTVGMYDNFSLEFHPYLLVYYAMAIPFKETPFGFDGLFAFEIGGFSREPGDVWGLGVHPADTLGLTVDEQNNRLVLVGKETGLGHEDYFWSAFTLKKNGALSEREPRLIFKLPNAQVPGVLKQIGVDGTSNTYVLADERIINGVARTFIQGFGEDGVKRFESQVGPDISNLVVHEAAGLIYVAENSASSQAKIKSIELATGRVSDLIVGNSENIHGAFASLGLDRHKGILYVGDTVSDSIFAVDLLARSMREQKYSRANRDCLVDEAVEN